MTKSQKYNSNTFLFTNNDNLPITPKWFDTSFWGKHETTSNTTSGRGAVQFLETEYGKFVIRKYRRGGFISKFVVFRFLCFGLKQSRPFRELGLLDYMQSKRLPSPTPIAALFQRHGISYEASIMTALIPDAAELFKLMLPENANDKSWPKINWQAIGSTIRRFHDTGIDHTDLNCHNIMLDKNNKIWLIDFDKCSLRQPKTSWQKSNLARLKRSLDKEHHKHEEFQFQNTDWQKLLEGYNG